MTTQNRTIEPAKYGNGYTVYEWGTYGKGSVLAGQTKKQFLDGFDTVEEAQTAYPDAEYDGCVRSAHNTVDHLPDPDDPSSWVMTDGEFDDGSF